MAAFAALKPCRFGSVDYGKGDIIPDGVVLPERVLSLTRMGYIAQAASKSVPEVGRGTAEPHTQEPESGREAQTGEPDAHPTGKKAANKK